MIATGQASIAFATAKTAVLDLGRKGFKQVIIFVPALSSDSYVSVSVSHDGTTYVQLEELTNGVEFDTVINSERSRVLDIAGARYITLTAPSTNQTVTVNAIAIPY